MDEPTEPKPKPRMAQRGPYVVNLEAGKEYYWCYCGRSMSQPFCDSSHEETEFLPQMFTVTETKQYSLCGCKRTATGPFCDTTHETSGGQSAI